MIGRCAGDIEELADSDSGRSDVASQYRNSGTDGVGDSDDGVYGDRYRHRISTIRREEKVVVPDRHEELIHQGGIYHLRHEP